MLFLTFYKAISTRDQVIFQNRFYFDNISKFSHKISELLSGVMSQNDPYKFLYCNMNTYMGKSSIEKWNAFAPELRYIWEVVESQKEAQVATTIQNHWVYGIHRLNRILVLMIPGDIPLHKLDDFAEKMSKDYFFKAYMWFLYVLILCNLLHPLSIIINQLNWYTNIIISCKFVELPQEDLWSMDESKRLWR